jgi:hypothetical protein
LSVDFRSSVLGVSIVTSVIDGKEKRAGLGVTACQAAPKARRFSAWSFHPRRLTEPLPTM